MSEDERYIEIDGRRWRRSDPDIPDTLASELVSELAAARRAVKQAKSDGDDPALSEARQRVHDAKVALGERGDPWWETSDEDGLRRRLAAAIRALLRKRGTDKTICPSDAARIAGGENWRDVMNLAREVAWQLEDEDWLEVVRKGEPVARRVNGPIRLRRR